MEPVVPIIYFLFLLVFRWNIHCSLGNKIDKRTTTFGKAGELTDMLCICHSQREDLCYTGASSGEIYIWQSSTYRKSIAAHKGAVYAMFALLQSEEKVIFTLFSDVSTVH